MNILLTNDDGFDAEGIQRLAETLRAGCGHRICIAAPDRNRSGVSQWLGLFSAAQRLRPRGSGGWECSGVPADCVFIAVRGGIPGFRPDLVISGINHGANMGTDIIYSGTVAAARQASLMGTPAIALSLAGDEPFHWKPAAAWVRDHLEELVSLWKQDTFVNVNLPNLPDGPLGTAFTWPGLMDYHDRLEAEAGEGGELICTLLKGETTAEEEPGCDWDAVSRNLASISLVFNHPVVRRDLCPGVPDHAAAGRRPAGEG